MTMITALSPLVLLPRLSLPPGLLLLPVLPLPVLLSPRLPLAPPILLPPDLLLLLPPRLTAELPMSFLVPWPSLPLRPLSFRFSPKR
ncbi:hypothetical protein BD777DRAFT_122591 [Yarrowia lipolytica]|nr:hypothetical protein BD777DRAFT_122591 [Yarrowia lipolytica]